VIHGSALEFVEWLVARHSDLKPLYGQHIDNNSELLPHVFFGDVTRSYEQLCAEGRVVEAQNLVADIDTGLQGESQYDEVDNLIHVSFLENLGHEKGRPTWEILTPRLKAGFDRIHGYTASS
jgi:hypothetical protein